MSRFLALNNLKIQFANLISFVRFSNNEGKFDINKDCERIFAKILTIHKRRPFIILEDTKKNFSGIDIASGDNKIAYQITSETSSSKIKDTLLKFYNKNIDEEFGSLLIIFLSDRYVSTITDNLLSDFLKGQLPPDKFKRYQISDFQVGNSVYNISKLIKSITETNTVGEINRISEIIHEELGTVGITVKKSILTNERSKPVDKIDVIEQLIELPINSFERKRNYYEIINLLEIYQSSQSISLSVTKKSEITLKKAIIYQKVGSTAEASNCLKQLEKINLNGTQSLQYILCKGKIISQTANNPDALEEFITENEGVIRNSPDKTLSHRTWAALLWRLSILYSAVNNSKSFSYLSKHKDISEPGSYQSVHNIQCAAINSLKFLGTGRNSSKIMKQMPITLNEAYSQYNTLTNFTYLDKCLATNLLLTAIYDWACNHLNHYYKKILIVRKVFIVLDIKYSDEAMAEIFFVIKNTFPEVFKLVFSKKLNVVFDNHAHKDLLTEQYFSIEEEFGYLNEKGTFNMNEIYHSLIF